MNQPSYNEVLKRFLLGLSERIFDSSVDRGMPSLAAAPDGPNTRPLLTRKAASIISFCSAARFRERSRGLLATPRGCRESQLSSTEKVSVSDRTTDRSMMFWSPRILPGQG